MTAPIEGSGPTRPCEGCGKPLPPFGSRPRCQKCQQAEDARVIAELDQPAPKVDPWDRFLASMPERGRTA